MTAHVFAVAPGMILIIALATLLLGYYSAQVVFFGAEFTMVHARRFPTPGFRAGRATW